MSQESKSVTKFNFISLDNKLKKPIPKKTNENENIDLVSSNYSNPAANQFKLPGFFQKINFPSKKQSDDKDFFSTNLLPPPESDYKNKFNPNSISSIFSQERAEATGINRVFRKSLTFLILHLVSFLLLNIIAINFFNNIIFNIIILILSISITNIFYIVVADRSYVWLGLIGQIFVTILANAFLGLAFNYITILLTVIIVSLNFLAYSELEKVQLSSRLFSISHVTTEASRILLTSAIILISLGIFNSIIHEGIQNRRNEGSKPFLDRVFFSNSFLMDNVFIGQSWSLSTNRFLINGKFFPQTGSQNITLEVSTSNGIITRQATFADYLERNYEFTNVLTKTEQEALRNTECVNVGFESLECDNLVEEEIRNRLEDWRVRAYGDLPLTLETPLTVDNFEDITRQLYLNQIEDFESEKDQNSDFIDSNLLLVPLTSIIPALIALVVIAILFAFRFVLNWLVFASNWFIWRILTWTGFVQIDIETVEAEIVSI